MPAPSTLKARRLRSTMTESEQALWRHLRRNNLGARFRRQHPVGPYVVDFACLTHGLAVEVDGGQHGEAVAYDQRRDAFLASRGFRVLRFWNNQVLQECDAVLEMIRLALEEGVRPPPSLPHAGGGG